MSIPDKALNAASEVLSQQLLGCSWSELNDQTSHAIAWDAQRILEAAAPFIRAEALNEYADECAQMRLQSRDREYHDRVMADARGVVEESLKARLRRR